MTKSGRQRTKLNQSGMVSFIVVSTVTIILSLITLGFSVIMGREQRQSVDNELSTQAFYAAESGMNDARAFLKANPTAVISKDTCIQNSAYANFAPFVKSLSGDYNSDPNDNLVQYTCTLINTSPTVVTKTIKAGTSTLIKMDPVDTIYFSWKNDPLSGHDKGAIPLGNKPSSDNAELPSETNALRLNKIGLLKAAIYPIANSVPSAPDANAAITAASRIFYLYPNAGSGIGDANFPTTPNGTYVNGWCNDTHPTTPAGLVNACNSRIWGITTSNIGGTYIQLTAQYEDLTVNIVTTNGLTTVPLPIKNVQATIDVTGEGNDVLKRIESFSSLSTQQISLPYAIQTTNTLCKRFRLPAVAGGSDPAYTDDPGSNQCVDATQIPFGP